MRTGIPSRAKGHGGMVLLEVITALTVFTVVAFSLIMALDAAFDAAISRNEIDVAMRGLENQVALVKGARLVVGERDVPADGSGFLYHISIEPEQMQDQKNQPVPNMYRVTITASWQSHGAADDRSVSELIYQP